MKNTTSRYKSIIQLVKYAVVGGIATGTNYILFLLLFHFLQFHYLIASVVAFIASVFIGFLIHRSWTFRLYNPSNKVVLRYAAVYLFSLLYSAGFLHVLVERFVLLPEWANVITIVSTGIFNYMGLKFYVFRK